MILSFLGEALRPPGREFARRARPAPARAASPPASPAAPEFEIDLESILDAAAGLVDRIRDGDREALETLYRVFWKGIRFQMYRSLGSSELDDRVHDTFLIVVQAIRGGELREPERLLGFIRTVVRRQIAYYLGRDPLSRVETDNEEAKLRMSFDFRETPEEFAMDRQNEAIVQELLRDLPARDREVLVRFYMLEQTQETICHEMKLSDNQYRLLKSRAKARFTELGRRRVAPNSVDRILIQRKAASSS